ncbi:transcriptional repressor LexA [Clostridium sp. CAG:265]|mgnify:FL=1|uniref:transcriptional repressor LexA n=1 Tax=Clostridium sp. CAG:265 TaxID=1262787 RepID=UPI0003406CE6|nr:transcriptional repressor LexA [Clostridium sp. CAG:265]CDB75427.1 lexA repressor [Clostridium sp. CAG:265]
MSELKDKQLLIYEFLKDFTSQKGYPPTVREICKAVGLKSTSSVHGHLKQLEKEGLIKRDPTKPRALEIVDSVVKKEMINVPIIGRVTAGLPILANENIEDSFPLPLDYVKHNNDLFMLKISGSSMIKAGILDGDFAIIERTQTASNGDKIVALIENEATLKTFYRENDHIRLQPENDDMEPIIVDNCSILGKLIGIYRTY